jgi:hypothetical protein
MRASQACRCNVNAESQMRLQLACEMQPAPGAHALNVNSTAALTITPSASFTSGHSQISSGQRTTLQSDSPSKRSPARSQGSEAATTGNAVPPSGRPLFPPLATGWFGVSVCSLQFETNSIRSAATPIAHFPLSPLPAQRIVTPDAPLW